MDLKKLTSNLKRIDTVKMSIKILNSREFKKFIADLNRSQLVKGFNDDGEQIGE